MKKVKAGYIRIEYWKVTDDATLHEVMRAGRNDGAGHRDVNHQLADNYN